MKKFIDYLTEQKLVIDNKDEETRKILDILMSEFNLGIHVWDSNFNEVPLSKATEMRFGYDKDGNCVDKLTNSGIKLPKNRSIDKLRQLIIKKMADPKLMEFEKLFNDLGKKLEIINNSWSIYSTTYGIGAMTMARNLATEVTKILDKNKIEYKSEFSDAGWVHKIIISKKSNNIKLIKEIVNGKNENVK